VQAAANEQNRYQPGVNLDAIRKQSYDMTDQKPVLGSRCVLTKFAQPRVITKQRAQGLTALCEPIVRHPDKLLRLKRECRRVCLNQLPANCNEKVMLA